MLPTVNALCTASLPVEQGVKKTKPLRTQARDYTGIWRRLQAWGKYLSTHHNGIKQSHTVLGHLPRGKVAFCAPCPLN